MLTSAIYTGQVFHKRYGPKEHTLQYNSFFLLLALEELPRLQNISSLFSWNRRAWFSFNDTDFGNNADKNNHEHLLSLQNNLEALLSARGFSEPHWRFELLTMPRTLGYAFNPISIIYCRDANNTPKAMIYEVNNTFGERIHYVLPVPTDQAIESERIRQRCGKELFVSPFFDMDGCYSFDVSKPNKNINFKIDYLVEDELKLRASFAGIRHDFTPQNLRSLALSHSATTYKVILGIHFEAVKLWWKGLALVNHVPLVIPDDEGLGTEVAAVTEKKKVGKIIYQPHSYTLKNAAQGCEDKKSELEQP